MTDTHGKSNRYGSAENYARQGKLPAAIREYETILETEPDNVAVLTILGDLHERLGQGERATAHLKRVAEAYVRDGFTVKAIGIYKKIVKLNPGTQEYLRNLADLYAQQGLYNDAARQYGALADQYERAGDLETAAKLFEKILEITTEDAVTRARLGQLNLRMNSHTEILKEQVTRFAYGDSVTSDDEKVVTAHLRQCSSCEGFVRFVRKSRAVARSEATADAGRMDCPSTDQLFRLKNGTLSRTSLTKARINAIRQHVLNCKWCRAEYLLISGLVNEVVPDDVFVQAAGPRTAQDGGANPPASNVTEPKEEIIRLTAEYEQYSQRLSKLQQKRFPTEDEKLEEVRLKKLMAHLEAKIQLASKPQVPRGKNRLA